MSDRGVVAGLAAPLILAASATSLALPPSRSVSPRTNTDPAPAWTLHPFHRLVVASTAQPRVAKARSAVVARAEVDRRALLAGAAALSAAVAAPAANAVDLIDDRGARAKGFDIIYEARDLDLPQAQRDGLSQARGDAALTKKRISESVARINGKLGSDIEKKYWTEAREELRRQIGTLSFDINTLASSLGKADRKEVEGLKKTLKAEVTALDFAIRKKNKDVAVKEYADFQAALGAVLSKIGA